MRSTSSSAFRSGRIHVARTTWGARRSADVAGALFYVLYDYGYYALGAPFNVFFVAYLALIRLSAYALIA